MQIPEELKEFKNKDALIIVSGTHTCSFYNISGDVIEKVDSFIIENPTYSDNEGFFQRRGRGLRFGSGSVRESKHGKVQVEFLHAFEDRFGKLKLPGDIVLYLFAPASMKKLIEEHMKTGRRGEIAMYIKGNFVDSHPLELLRKIGSLRESSGGVVSMMKREAFKILQRSRKARRIIGKK